MQQKLESGQSVPSLDKRGKHFVRPTKIKDEVTAYIGEHIE